MVELRITPDDEILPNMWMDERRYCEECKQIRECEVMYYAKTTGNWAVLEINWLCHD